MQKRLAALLSCSLLFLLGFSGCCKDSCKKQSTLASSAKSSQKKASCKGKKGGSEHAKVAALYNIDDTDAQIRDISDEDFGKLTFDEREITDFDATQVAYGNDDATLFDAEAQKGLKDEIDTLVSLWKAQDDSVNEADSEIDFKMLYLDTDKPVIDPTDASKEFQIAHAETPAPLEESKIALTDDLQEKDEKNITIEDATARNQHLSA